MFLMLIEFLKKTHVQNRSYYSFLITETIIVIINYFIMRNIIAVKKYRFDFKLFFNYGKIVYPSQILLSMTLYIFCAGCQTTNQPTEISSLSSNHTYVTSFPRLLSCKVEGYSGKVLDMTTPALVNLKTLGKPIRIKCNHVGYWTSNIILEPSSNIFILSPASVEEPSVPFKIIEPVAPLMSSPKFAPPVL